MNGSKRLRLPTALAALALAGLLASPPALASKVQARTSSATADANQQPDALVKDLWQETFSGFAPLATAVKATRAGLEMAKAPANANRIDGSKIDRLIELPAGIRSTLDEVLEPECLQRASAGKAAPST